MGRNQLFNSDELEKHDKAQEVQKDARAAPPLAKPFSSAISKWFLDITNGTCPECGEPMEKVQLGICVYASPCGHRLYQGKI